MRRRMLASLGGGWKNPYVTDGLLAMWDGIDNAGWGVHDPNATVWLDLVNPDKALSLTNVSFTPVSAVFRGNGIATISKTAYETSGLEDTTTEMFFTLKSLNTTETHFINSFNFDLYMYLSVLYATKKPIGFITSKNPVVIGSRFLSIAHNTDSCKLMVDSNLYSTTRIASDRNSENWITIGNYSHNTSHYGLSADVHCVRVYDRKLTLAEVAANYAVDKARFGLP